MAFDLAEAWVAETEAALGARLPAGYRAAMMRHNGGGIALKDEDWELYPIRDGSDRKRIARTCSDILAETRACREWRGFPPGALAIAGNGGGDHLLFLRQDDVFGAAVYAWRHESGQLDLVAAGFEAL